MKKVIYINVALILSLYFFVFTNTGGGMLEFVNNLRKGDPQTPAINEIVMPPYSMIEASLPEGKIIIKSGKGLKRYYTWDGATRSVVMTPRTKRWFGSLGLYYPGDGFHWIIGHNGIKRGVLEEGQQNFNTNDEALAWLHMNPGCVYRDDGLVVFYSKRSHTLIVDVWQIYVEGKTLSPFEETAGDRIGGGLEEHKPAIFKNSKNTAYFVGGHKPTRLEGSNNNLIRTSWDTKNSSFTK
jgi:hypothetical protein